MRLLCSSFNDGLYKQVLKRRDQDEDVIGVALLNHERTMNKLARRLSRIDLADRLQKAESVAKRVQERQAEEAQGNEPTAKRARGSQF